MPLAIDFLVEEPLVAPWKEAPSAPPARCHPGSLGAKPMPTGGWVSAPWQGESRRSARTPAQIDDLSRERGRQARLKQQREAAAREQEAEEPKLVKAYATAVGAAASQHAISTLQRERRTASTTSSGGGGGGGSARGGGRSGSPGPGRSRASSRYFRSESPPPPGRLSPPHRYEWQEQVALARCVRLWRDDALRRRRRQWAMAQAAEVAERRALEQASSRASLVQTAVCFEDSAPRLPPWTA